MVACVRCSRSKRARAQAQVFIDGNAALAAATAGLANLPEEFFAASCPSFEEIEAIFSGTSGSF